jgi:imidazoleglycerol phosphate synthase glutamine amidotransferase subunit HisH
MARLKAQLTHACWSPWNCRRPSALLSRVGNRRVYFVHSYHATPSAEVRLEGRGSEPVAGLLWC